MEIDTMGLGMITNNRIQGFVPSIFTQIDGRKYVKYNVSSKVTMKQFFSGEVNRSRLVSVFAEIAGALIQAEEYMLDINSIVLDTDYIFVNVSDYSIEVIYVPVEIVNGGNTEAAMFFKNIMFTTRFDASENCDYVAEIINFLNRTGVFSILQFKELLERLKWQPQDFASEKGNEGTPGNSSVEVTNDTRKPMVRENAPEFAPKPERETKPAAILAKQVKAPDFGDFGVPNPQKQDNGAAPSAVPEKGISLFYLLQHYNKENAEAYKEQKEVKRQRKNESADKVPKEKKPPKEKKAKKEKGHKQKTADAAVSFSVPGQQNFLSASLENVKDVPVQHAMSLVADVQETAPIAVPAMQNQLPGNEGFGETEYFSQDTESNEGTVLMGADEGMQKMQPYLIRLKNNERIPLDKDIFRIGRGRESSDYAIPENKFVGHSHCHILAREGEYFIVDENSKNHTYVNGTMINNNAERKLSHGTIIGIANEEFEFRLF